MSVDGLDGLRVGISVDIQRTDGRIHSAVVSGVNEASKSVTVEWYEKGEAKGKEVEFDAIYQFNPSLIPERPPPQSVVSENQPPAVPPTANKTRAGGGGGPPPPSSRIRAPGQGVNGRPTTQQSHQPTPAIPVAAPVPLPLIPQQPGEESPPSPVDNEYTFIDDGGDQGDKSKLNKNRKSHCVKQIEKIQQRRDERRAAQKAIREQPEFDPSNPNYEFLQMIRDFQEKLDYQPLSENDPIENNYRICVCVRKRPLNKKEFMRKEIDVTTVPNRDTVIIHEPKLKVDLTKYLENQQFRFDFAFEDTATNEMVYKCTARPLVQSIFEGGMATCFAYGQTGSGKTHTMGGEFHGKGQQDCSNGIYALASRDVFRLLNSKYKKDNLYIEAAFFEIYSGKVFDLLNKKEKLRVLEDAKSQVQVVGLKMEVVESVDDVLKLLQHGNLIRTSGTTSANQHSSRSHAVFQLILKKATTKRLHGKFSLIDLAGNERGADTSSSDRLTRMEGAEINKSLLALKECIRALGRKGAHLPFRASKLTQVLRDSFIGDKSRTCMIATVSPGFSCCEHSLNTLRYADRVKELGTNDPVGGGGGGAGGAPLRDNNRGGGVIGGGRGDDLDAIMDEDGILMDDDDLAMLMSQKGEDMTEEMLTFQEVFSHIEKMEEEVCDEHKTIVDTMDEWNTEHKKLYKISNQVDYNMEEYASKLEGLLAAQIEQMSNLRSKVSAWKSELKQEEEINTQYLKKKDASGKK